MDTRTKEILEMYHFNEACPNYFTRKELDNIILFNAFQDIQKSKPRLF